MAENFSDLMKLQQNLDRLQKTQREELFEECIKELALRFLAKVVERTPVGDYSKEIEVTAKRDSKYHKKGDVYTKRVPSDKKGGTLRRGWIAESMKEAESREGSPTKEQMEEYVKGMRVKKSGDSYSVEIKNPVSYTSYVEYGHRTTNHKGYVPGYLMMTVTQAQIEKIAPSILQRKLNKILEDAFK